MSLTKLEKDMGIIQKLDDEPNDVGGLSAADLKKKFDESGETVKTFLNDTLIPEIEQSFAETAKKQDLSDVVLGQIPDHTLTEEKLSEDLSEKLNSAAPKETVFTREETLTQKTAALYGLTNEAVPDDVFELLSAANRLKLLQSYTEHGSYTFDGSGYSLLVALIIGGGGSGAVSVSFMGSIQVSGGASGHFKIAVVEKSKITNSMPVIVGKGGDAVSAQETSKNGNSGGSSSFAGITASGGQYGSTSGSFEAKGAQNSPPADESYKLSNQTLYGMLVNHTSQSLLDTLLLSKIYSVAGENLCNFSAGGCAIVNGSTLANMQSSITFTNGKKSSAGIAQKYITSGASDASAVKGDDPGCGGGGVVSANSVTATSAAGCDGAVFIFGQ